jgi:hypothetical protein
MEEGPGGALEVASDRLARVDAKTLGSWRDSAGPKCSARKESAVGAANGAKALARQQRFAPGPHPNSTALSLPPAGAENPSVAMNRMSFFPGQLPQFRVLKMSSRTASSIVYSRYYRPCVVRPRSSMNSQISKSSRVSISTDSPGASITSGSMSSVRNAFSLRRRCGEMT